MLRPFACSSSHSDSKHELIHIRTRGVCRTPSEGGSSREIQPARFPDLFLASHDARGRLMERPGNEGQHNISEHIQVRYQVSVVICKGVVAFK